MPLDLHDEVARRPWWMNVMFGLCLFGTFIYLPFEILTKPLVDAEEVWFGVTLRGGAARAGELAHWAVYASGAWGLWRMRPWLPIVAAIYMVQVAIAHVIWSELDPRGNGILVGLVQATVFMTFAVLLWRSRDRFPAASGHHPASR
jgi:hypothetical protein